MKKIFLIFKIVFIATSINAQEIKIQLTCEQTKRPDFRTERLIIKHIDSPKIVGDKVKVGDSAGNISKLPDKVSKRFESQYRKAENLYAQQKFNEAVRELEKPISLEKDNPFLWNLNARSLYAANKRKESFYAYKKLISIIDSEEIIKSDGTQQLTIIDAWFLEGYWKISSLYLDYEEYEKSIFYNRKKLDVITLGNTFYDPIRFQYNVDALSYLAEAYYFLNDKEANNYYACETLKLDNKNQYVMNFILY